MSLPDITESYNFVSSELTQQCSSSNEKSAENCEIDDDIVMNDSCYTIDDVVPMDTQNDYDDCSADFVIRKVSSHSKFGSDPVSLQDIEPWSFLMILLLYSSSNVLNSKISLWEGDITKLNIDCIVNAATEHLEGGGGIDGAIHRAAGPDLLDACKKFPIINNRTNNRCETGECKLTHGFNLLAKYIIHTVCPRDKNASSKLKSCFENYLIEVLQNNIKTIAFCCIATCK